MGIKVLSLNNLKTIIFPNNTEVRVKPGTGKPRVIKMNHSFHTSFYNGNSEDMYLQAMRLKHENIKNK